jgi:TonB family protein
MSEGRHAWLADRDSEPVLSWMIVLSAILHVAAAAVFFMLPKDFFVRSVPPVVAYTVKIVDASALGGRLPKGEIHPDSAPQGIAQPAPKEEAKPEPKPKPEKKPEPKPEPEKKVVKLPDVTKKPEPEKEKPVEKKKAEAKKKEPEKPKPTAREKAEAARDREIQEAVRRLGEKGKGKHASGLGGVEEGKGAALGIGGDGGGGGILTGLDFIIYKNQVEAIIKKNWTWVGANPNLTVRLGFSIAKDGQITDLRIASGSGDASFDESVLRAVRISNPLPPPPEKYRQAFANYVLEFVSGELASGG